MKRLDYRVLLLLLILAGSLGAGLAFTQPAAGQTSPDPIVTGARLYDDWMAEKGVNAPQGNQPLWATQTTNTLSGADTYRCATCHGWDYQGKDGAYRSGANFTGFPGVYVARTYSEEQILSILKGETNPGHDFSMYLSNEDLQALTAFIQKGVIDDGETIDLVTMKVQGGDAVHGQELYTAACAECHGVDGQKIQFRQEGQDIVLGSLADQDPWRFLHRTRFGLARAPEMKIGYDLGWTVQDGRDVLLVAQSFPTISQQPQQPSPQNQTPSSPGQPGGPANNIIAGILTALAAMATSLGFAVILGSLLVGLLLLVVWLLRNKK